MSHFWMLTLIGMLAGYLVGSLPSAIFVCRFMGLPDPRKEGSGNPGTTNVLRIGGKRAAILTLLGDVLKGVLPVVGARCFHADTLSLCLIALAAFLGHLYPVFFGFKGGKGVATAFGGLSAIHPLVGVWLASTWLVVALLFRYSSLAALVTAVLAPLYVWHLTGAFPAVVTAIMSLWLIWRHRSNIRNLLAGKEKKIGRK